ncbi:hypothetical protein NCCP2050_22700 [Planococcus sp. NCCP-2050]|nr:hypothetical protein NCCP2050_22700 [Planococcus sp. NCCP-2050]
MQAFLMEEKKMEKLYKKLLKKAKHFETPSDINTVRQSKRIWALAKNKKHYTEVIQNDYQSQYHSFKHAPSNEFSN